MPRKKKQQKADDSAAESCELVTIPTEPLVIEHSVIPGKRPALLLTDGGRVFLRQLAKFGATEAEAAAAIGMSVDWLKKQLIEDEAARQAWDSGDAMGKLELRAAGDVLSKINAQVHIWMRKQRLGEKDKSETEVKHRIHVVGTLPAESGYDATDWQKQFAPTKDDEGEGGAKQIN